MCNLVNTDLVDGGGRLEEEGLASVMAPNGCINNNVGDDYFDRIGHDTNHNNNGNSHNNNNSNENNDNNNNNNSNSNAKIPLRTPSSSSSSTLIASDLNGNLKGGRVSDGGSVLVEAGRVLADGGTSESLSASSAFALIADTAAGQLHTLLQYILSIYSFNTSFNSIFQHTPSTHPSNILFQHILSIHFFTERISAPLTTDKPTDHTPSDLPLITHLSSNLTVITTITHNHNTLPNITIKRNHNTQP